MTGGANNHTHGSVHERPFSEAEDAYLRAHADQSTPNLARTLGRPEKQVYYRLELLGLRGDRQNSWTAERDAELKRLFEGGVTDAAIGRALGCSEKSVANRRKRLGLLKHRPGPIFITAEQKADIRKLRRQGSTPAVIAEALGVRLSRVKQECEAIAGELARPVVANDDEFVARLLSLGGLPRAVVTPSGTVWVGPDDQPWTPREIAA